MAQWSEMLLSAERALVCLCQLLWHAALSACSARSRDFYSQEKRYQHTVLGQGSLVEPEEFPAWRQLAGNFQRLHNPSVSPYKGAVYYQGSNSCWAQIWDICKFLSKTGKRETEEELGLPLLALFITEVVHLCLAGWRNPGGQVWLREAPHTSCSREDGFTCSCMYGDMWRWVAIAGDFNGFFHQLFLSLW